MTALLVMLGAAVGAVLRLLVSRRLPGPAGTLLVNVVGSGLLGLLAGASGPVTALFGVGFCGGLTTFSTFAVEGAQTRSARLVAATVVLCLAAAGLGLWLAS